MKYKIFWTCNAMGGFFLSLLVHSNISKELQNISLLTKCEITTTFNYQFGNSECYDYNSILVSSMLYSTVLKLYLGAWYPSLAQNQLVIWDLSVIYVNLLFNGNTRVHFQKKFSCILFSFPCASFFIMCIQYMVVCTVCAGKLY